MFDGLPRPWERYDAEWMPRDVHSYPGLKHLPTDFRIFRDRHNSDSDPRQRNDENIDSNRLSQSLRKNSSSCPFICRVLCREKWSITLAITRETGPSPVRFSHRTRSIDFVVPCEGTALSGGIRWDLTAFRRMKIQ